MFRQLSLALKNPKYLFAASIPASFHARAYATSNTSVRSSIALHIMAKRKRGAAAISPAPPTEGIDGLEALRASPGDEAIVGLSEGATETSQETSQETGTSFEPSEEPERDPDEVLPVVKKKAPKRRSKVKLEESAEEEPKERPPAVNSDYVPVPWKGRLGYACLNTYLRTSNPPIFCSRTCRIETILKQGGYENGCLEYVQSLGLANARDLSRLIKWNEKYGIKFLRISSEMFPFASHPKYGYDLNFAKEALGEAGKLAMEFGHRLTTHPGQFTQLGSPRPEVITASVRDLEYHSQLFQNLGFKGQFDKDAVMILHMGGMFGDKGATLDRFRENYTTLLSEDIKNRLVLENDDVTWSVHDLLPICKELNIPMVLDYHHHNIVHDLSLREGTLDVMPFFDEIKETWTRKGITQKQHYSEPCPGAFTDREMRKHSPRVAVLPPCAPDMDLMIEAKDKEQAVFELYKKYKIGPEGLFNEVIPHKRTDENKPPKKVRRKKGDEDVEPEVVKLVPEDEVGMGGEERRVYWPQGYEHWLSPPKRVVKKKQPEEDELGDGEPFSPKKKTKPRKGKSAVKEEPDDNKAPPAKNVSKKTEPSKKKEVTEAPAPAKKRVTKKAPVVKEEDSEVVEGPSVTKRRATKKAPVVEENAEDRPPAKVSRVTKSKRQKKQEATLPPPPESPQRALARHQTRRRAAVKSNVISPDSVEDASSMSDDSPLSELETDSDEVSKKELIEVFVAADQDMMGRRRSERLSKRT